ncbi:MAG: hypothetical protein OXE78_08990 [Gammaproteobacteria bacterium]|nr:hypothetical protein [Gammaproteobacteria bacterium]MCY4356311.1 hypothetical protein [Gammaproteobacteria bacterium]
MHFNQIFNRKFLPRMVLWPSWLLLFALSENTSLAQSIDDQAAILKTVNRFFDALANRDRKSLLKLTIPGSLNISVENPVEDTTQIRIQNYSQLINGMGTEGPHFLERYWEPIVLIEGNIAVFWAPYDFHIDGIFSHCGIDSFQLVKREGEWLLSNLSWTRQRQGCEPSPLVPL